jgi:hypothetical protein
MREHQAYLRGVDLTPYSYMGPFYHLLQPKNRELTLLEAGRRLKQGVFLIVATIIRFAPLRQIAENDPQMITGESEIFSEIVDLGIRRAGGAGPRPDYYFRHPEELMRMIAAAGFVKLEIVGCEGVVSSVEDKVNGLTGDVWES